MTGTYKLDSDYAGELICVLQKEREILVELLTLIPPEAEVLKTYIKTKLEQNEKIQNRLTMCECDDEDMAYIESTYEAIP